MSNEQISRGASGSRAVFFDRAASVAFIGFLAVVPIFLIPFLRLPIDLSKIYFVSLFGILACIAWIIARLVDGAITLPRTPILWALAAIPVTFLISALFSPATAVSLAGVSLGVGSVAVITLLTLVFFGSVLYLSTPRRLSFFFKLLLGSTLIISVFQILYLVFGSRFFSLGIFFSDTSNVIGRWNDLGIFFGAVALAVIVALEIMPLSRNKRIGLSGLFAVSFFFLALVNFPLLWGIIAAFSIILLVYSLAVLRPRALEPRSHFPVVPFIAILIALFFLIANPIVGSVLPRFFGVSQGEVRPSVEATAAVTWQSLKKSPVVGVGPNRFENAWLMYRPSQIIATDFWDTSFGSGFGLLPSFVATTGILGTLALITFLLLYFIAGILHVFRSHEKREIQGLILLTFTLSLYAWILMFIYNPGIIGVLIAFVFSGAFIGLLAHEGALPIRRASFLEDPRKSFFSILGLVAFLIAMLVVLFVGTKKFIALVSYTKGTQAGVAGDLVKAEKGLTRAAALDSSDLYYRGLVNLRLTQIKKLVATEGVSQETLKQDFQTLFKAAETAAESAVRFDKTNPENWIALAALYQEVVPLQVEGAYANAKTAYEEARKLSPNNPGFDVLRARLEITAKNLPEAKKFVDQAIASKRNFVDAYFLLAQIQSASGDTASAKAALETAVSIAPNSAATNLELALFKYRAADYAGAVPLFERALVLDRSSATTAYFLGLSYEKVGRIEEAKKIFELLSASFPNDSTLKKMIENLAAGKASQDGIISTTPAPVTEETKKTDSKA
jgi:tetratricopeptide (TPR) repeat protein